MLKPTKTRIVKEFLKVVGMENGSTKGDMEAWDGIDKNGNEIRTIFNCGEEHVPAITIVQILKDVKETEQAFERITSIIDRPNVKAK